MSPALRERRQIEYEKRMGWRSQQAWERQMEQGQQYRKIADLMMVNGDLNLSARGLQVSAYMQIQFMAHFALNIKIWLSLLFSCLRRHSPSASTNSTVCLSFESSSSASSFCAFSSRISRLSSYFYCFSLSFSKDIFRTFIWRLAQYNLYFISSACNCLLSCSPICRSLCRKKYFSLVHRSCLDLGSA